MLCRFPDRARHFARPDLCARGGQEDCALYQKRPTPQGGSTSPKAMPTAVGAIIDYRRLSSLLSTRPQIAFHRLEKSAREIFASAHTFYLETISLRLCRSGSGRFFAFDNGSRLRWLRQYYFAHHNAIAHC